MWDNDTLLDAIACTRRETWLARIMRHELANRGLGHKGEWVGFKQAATIWCDQEGT